MGGKRRGETTVVVPPTPPGCEDGVHHARVVDGVWACVRCDWTRPFHPPVTR